MIAAIKRKLLLITIVYWFLLLYMFAALLWWYIALEKQNAALANTKLEEIPKNDIALVEKQQQIFQAKNRKTTQYIGEGVTFLAIIIVGAIYVYRATRKQIMLSAQQQNFMMAVTHELKTPIAVAVLNLETMQRRKLDEAQQQKLITNTLQEADRLNALCNNILLAAQLDAKNYHTNKQSVNLSSIINKSCKEFANRYPDKIINTKIQADVLIIGEELLLQMLINNLLENAIKYSPKNTPITVSLTNKETTLLQVADEGFGIADADKKQIFQKFYRAGDENTRQTKGTGLGLYLCSKIAKYHNGKIFVQDNKPNGTIFNIEFL